MYPVSDAFLQAVQENTRKFYWTGRITTKAEVVHEFDFRDIVKGSGYISHQCCGSTEIELGTVYAAEMGISLFSQIDRYTMENAKIELYYHLQLADSSYEVLPMGIFEVSEANRHIKTLEPKAYDYMLRFEKNFNGFGTIGTAYDFLTLCCKACDVKLAQMKEQIAAFPNADIALSIYPENDIETYRDLLFYTAQVLGCFCCINREGKLELRKYTASPVQQIVSRHRFSSSFSDFITRYTAVSSTNLRTQAAEYYALDPDDGLTMNLGVNPLLQFGLEETRKQLCENILQDLSAVSYVPFDSDTIGNPALDLGDILTFSGGQADETKHTCITAVQYKIGGKQSLKCVGKNPRLAQAKSKNDKNLTGLLNQIEKGKIGFFSFVNAKVFELAETELQVINIDFTAGEVTQAEFIGLVIMDVTADCVKRESTAAGTIVVPIPTTSAAESNLSINADMKKDTDIAAEMEAETSPGQKITDVSVEVNLPVTWEMDGKAVVQARYTLNGTDIELFYPTQTYGSGRYTFPLYYPVSNVLPNLLNNFSVYFSVAGGTVRIEKGTCIAAVTGQGLAAGAAADWDGTLKLEETIQKYPLLNWFSQGTLTDSVSAKTDRPQSVGILQTVAKTAITGLPMLFEEGRDNKNEIKRENNNRIDGCEQR